MSDDEMWNVWDGGSDLIEEGGQIEDAYNSLPLIKEINKIDLKENEVLVIKPPKDTDASDAKEIFETFSKMLNTDKIVIMCGDIELTKVENKSHPLY